jgi:hypothetical protein
MKNPVAIPDIVVMEIALRPVVLSIQSEIINGHLNLYNHHPRFF